MGGKQTREKSRGESVQCVCAWGVGGKQTRGKQGEGKNVFNVKCAYIEFVLFWCVLSWGEMGREQMSGKH